MAEQDTIRLLRECDAGIRMGISSIGDVIDSVKSEDLRRTLMECKETHEKLKKETQDQLETYQDEGKAPNPMAKGMSWIKSNVMLAMDQSDATVADLMTDGCNMGVKSLHRYLNQYRAADEGAKDIARRLADSEEKLAQDVRSYL